MVTTVKKSADQSQALLQESDITASHKGYGSLTSSYNVHAEQSCSNLIGHVLCFVKLHSR